jgi:hypothetical protein
LFLEWKQGFGKLCRPQLPLQMRRFRRQHIADYDRIRCKTTFIRFDDTASCKEVLRNSIFGRHFLAIGRMLVMARCVGAKRHQNIHIQNAAAAATSRKNTRTEVQKVDPFHAPDNTDALFSRHGKHDSSKQYPSEDEILSQQTMVRSVVHRM